MNHRLEPNFADFSANVTLIHVLAGLRKRNQQTGLIQARSFQEIGEAFS
jgi:hypothetical protein